MDDACGENGQTAPLTVLKASWDCVTIIMTTRACNNYSLQFLELPHFDQELKDLINRGEATSTDIG